MSHRRRGRFERNVVQHRDKLRRQWVVLGWCWGHVSRVCRCFLTSRWIFVERLYDASYLWRCSRTDNDWYSAVWSHTYCWTTVIIRWQYCYTQTSPLSLARLLCSTVCELASLHFLITHTLRYSIKIINCSDKTKRKHEIIIFLVEVYVLWLILAILLNTINIFIYLFLNLQLDLASSNWCPFISYASSSTDIKRFTYHSIFNQSPFTIGQRNKYSLIWA